MKAVATILFLTLAAPLLAQTPAKLKQELRDKEAAAKKDPDALFEAGKWAAEKGLAADAKRIYQAVLKIKPDHEATNLAIGNALLEGKWLPAKEVEALKKKAQAAEFAAKGFVEVGGVWVEKEHVEDAKLGIYHHEDQLVTKDEKLALLGGKVRHPETDELIDAKDLERAKNRYFPIGSEGRWVDEKEANTYHSDSSRPWIVRSTYCTLVSTLPIAKLQELKLLADRGYERVQPLLGSRRPSPAQRPVVIIAATESEYREFGTGLGDGTDAAGAFLMREEALVKIPYQGDTRGAICYLHKEWGPYYIRHAAALAYTHGIAADAGADLPLWLEHGLASYASRFENDRDAGWFGKQHVQKGGVRNLKAFFAGFAINGEMESKDIDYNVFQAGLMISFAAHGGDAKVTEAMQEVTAALSGAKKGGADKAVTKLTNLLIDSEKSIVAHLQKLVAKAP